MKENLPTKTTFLLLIYLVLSSTILLSQTQYEWEYVNSLQNEWMQKICTQGLDTVYIVGENGLIAKSTDRALTWSKQYPVTAQLNDIIFVNHTTGFAVGDNGTILRTTDAGANWTQQNSGVTVNLNAIAATGIDNIWIVGDSGKVVFSTDTGTTWQKKDFSTTAKLNDISFRNNTGYIVGNAHTCFYTSDNGSNWSIKDIALYNPYVTDLISINQTTNHTCILIGDNYIGCHGLFINVDNNKFVIPVAYYITNFTMKSDSIGYGSSFIVTTGKNDGYDLRVEIFNLNKYSYYLNDFMSVGDNNTFSFDDFDYYHSDMSFANDSIGYLACGAVLYYLTKYVPVIHDGLSENKDKKLSLLNNSNILTILFGNEKIDKIELYSITGLKVLTEKINPYETSKSINVNGFSKGTYIIRARCVNNTFINLKWIKQ